MEQLEKLGSHSSQNSRYRIFKKWTGSDQNSCSKMLTCCRKSLHGRAQIRLSLLGYDVGKIDGLWGKNSQRALDDYLSESASPNSNTVNSRLLRSMDLSLENLAPPLTMWGEYAQFFNNSGNLQNVDL